MLKKRLMIHGLLRGASFLIAATLMLALCACGGGSSTESSAIAIGFPASAASQLDSNVAVINVTRGPGTNVNIPYVSVTVCMPGSTTQCKTIDNVLLDTGSTGLRLFASDMNAAPALPLPSIQVAGTTNIYECAQFLDSKAWGTVKNADVIIGAKHASNVPVQIINTNFPSALESSCGGSLMVPPSVTPLTNQSALSANGVLGTGIFVNDGQTYFDCTGTYPTQLCGIINLPASKQVQNPVALFATDNNGVIVQLPALPDSGSTSASGYLIFGIDTSQNNNNALGSANVVPVNHLGRFTTRYNNQDLTNSFIDSGSNGLFFNDPSLPTNCTSGANGFYCPTTAQPVPLSATIRLTPFTGATVNFKVANSNTLFQGNRYAFNNLGGTLSTNSFDWGLPFFFGRSVYTAIEGKPVGNRVGPFYAFTN